MTNRSKSLPSAPPAESFKPPQPPKLSHVIPLSNFKEEPQELLALEDHQAFKRSQVMKLVKTQINPSMRYIRSKQGRMSEGPFVVAQNVSGEVYDESVLSNQIVVFCSHALDSSDWPMCLT